MINKINIDIYTMLHLDISLGVVFFYEKIGHSNENVYN